jgi:hypothetical protein
MDTHFFDPSPDEQEGKPRSVWQHFEQDKEFMLRFRRVLFRPDQWVIDELLAYAEKHIYSVAYANHPAPFVMSLFAMVVEQHKRIRKIEEAINALKEGKWDNGKKVEQQPDSVQ